MIDFERLCDYQIQIEKLAPSRCSEVINRFRSGCLQFSIKNSDIPIAAPEFDQKFGAGIPAFPHVKYIVTSISKLLNRPRKLKSCLREVLKAWRTLHGEVNFDDLLILRTIRAVCPHAFRAIRVHYDDLVREGRDWIHLASTLSPKKESLTDRFDEEWMTAIDQMNSEGKTEMNCLLKYIFPFLNRDVDTLVTRDQIWPQSAIEKKYWFRILEGVDDNLNDQITAKATIKWLAGESADFVTTLASKEQVANTVESLQLSHGLLPQLRLNAEKVRLLAGDLFDHVRNQFSAEATRDSSQTFYTVWRIANDRGGYAPHYDWILEEIKKSMPISLCFVNDLDYFWGQNSTTTPYTTYEKSNELRSKIVGEMARVLSGEQLPKVLGVSDRSCYALHHAVRHLYGIEHGRPEFNRTKWKWLPQVLVSAMQANPRVCMHVAILLSVDEYRFETSGEQIRTRRYRFDDVFLNDLFFRKKELRQQAKTMLLNFTPSVDMGFEQQMISMYEDIVQSIISP